MAFKGLAGEADHPQVALVASSAECLEYVGLFDDLEVSTVSMHVDDVEPIGPECLQASVDRGIDRSAIEFPA